MHHLLCKHSWVRVFQRVGFAQGFAIAAPLRGCFTGYNTATKHDVRLCGIAWLHPEIPFCTQTGLSILTRIGSTVNTFSQQPTCLRAKRDFRVKPCSPVKLNVTIRHFIITGMMYMRCALGGGFTGNNKMKNRDVRLCGIAWLHPAIPFCTQTGFWLLK